MSRLGATSGLHRPRALMTISTSYGQVPLALHVPAVQVFPAQQAWPLPPQATQEDQGVSVGL